jgi:hypothetical protein
MGFPTGSTVPVPSMPLDRDGAPGRRSMAADMLPDDMRSAMISAAFTGGAQPTVMRVPADRAPRDAPAAGGGLPAYQRGSQSNGAALPVATAPSAPASRAPDLQMATMDLARSFDVPSVQRSPEAAPTPTGGASTGGASTTTATESSTAPEPAAAAGPAPEEMAAKLFEPLLRRLRAELRQERDRNGAVSDLHGY